MKKIFILTGEPSGDKLAAEVIKELKKSNSFNHVQALVLNNHKIVSLEKRKGTKEMLKSMRSDNLKKIKTVTLLILENLVKF